jgi:hypothetical protein
MNGHVVVTPPPLHACIHLWLLQNWRRALLCQHSLTSPSSPRRRCAADNRNEFAPPDYKVDVTMTHSVSRLLTDVS